MVALDVGGALSVKSEQYYDGKDIYRSAQPGAYAFTHMLKYRTGRYPKVISRVNNPSDNHWFVRFCESLGVPRQAVTLVKNKPDQAEHSLGCTCVVDDNWDALRALASGAHETLVEAHWFHDTREYLPKPKT